MPVIQVQPWGENQGDFVLIEEADFNPDFHALFGAAAVASEAKSSGITANQAKERLDALGVTYKPSASKAELLTLLEKTEADSKVAELKAALKAKDVSFEDDADQATLQSLLDAAK